MAQSKYYNTGGGILYIRPLVNGVLGAEAEFGQTEDIAFSTEIENLTHNNTESNVVYEDMNILKKITGKLTISTIEISPEMLTRAFLGTNFTVNVPSAIGTANNAVVAVLDVAVPIGTKHLSNVVVKDDADLITYVLGTDYTLNLMTGELTALTAGAILESDVLHVTFDNANYDDIRIEAFLNTKIEGQLRFVSDTANGVEYVYTFHRVSLLASGDFNLKSAEDFSTLAFEGTMLASELITAPNESKLFKIEGTELI